MNFPKSADDAYLRPSSDQLLDYTKRYLPVGLLAGAGSAGLVHLLAKMNELKNEQKVQESNPDTLTVNLPAPKVAAFNPRGALSAVYNYIKARPVVRGLGALGTAGAATWAGAAGYQAAKGPHQVGDNILDAAAPIALAGGGALLSYGLVDNILQNRERQQLKDRLDSAKNQYGNMLGQTLASANASKAAGIESVDDLFPTIHGICLGLVDAEFPGHEKEATSTSNLLFTAGLTGLPTLAAILAHKWMYKRQMELDALHQSEKPKPPKQIRLVSAQPTTPEIQPEGEPLALPEPKMANELPEILGAVMASQALKGEEGKPEKPARRPGMAPMPKATDIAPGTTQITTSEGPVEVEAQDPAAAALMAHGGSKKLTQLLSIFQAQPAVSGAEQPGV